MDTHLVRTRFLVSIVLAAALASAAACGSSSPSAPETVTPVVTTPQTTAVSYTGTFQAIDGSFGSLTLVAQIPVAALSSTNGVSQPKASVSATGTIRKAGEPVATTLTGTYDTVTGKFTMTGGIYTLVATVSTNSNGTQVSGTVTTPTTNGAVVALPPPPGGTVLTYCGNFTGDGQGNLLVTRRDNRLVVLVREPGLAPYTVEGSLTGTAVLIKFDFAPPDVGTTTVTGTLTGTTMQGTWVSNYVERGVTIVDRGDWVVRAGTCPL